jgi:hypothetical protein
MFEALRTAGVKMRGNEIWASCEGVSCFASMTISKTDRITEPELKNLAARILGKAYIETRFKVL